MQPHPIDFVSVEPPRLRSIACDSVSLRRPLNWVLLALAALFPISMWLNGVIEHPGAPIEMRLLLVMGDSQYFDVLQMMGSGTFGEHAILEHRGEGFLAFPMIPFLVAVPLFKLLGIAGLFVAVGVTLWLALVACQVMLRCIGLAPAMAAVAAVLVAVPWEDYSTVGASPFLNLWAPRIGRPMGTVPQMLASLALLALIARSPRHRFHPGVWALLAALSLLTLQGDLHTGIVLGFASAIAWLASLATGSQPRARRRLLLGALAAAGSGLVVLIPFLISRARSHPDGAAHLGLMKLSRSFPFFDTGSIVPYTAMAIMATAVVAAIAILHRRMLRVPADQHPATAFRFVPALLVLAYVALPLSIIVLGQGAQLFHFRDTIRYLTTISFFTSLFLLLQLAIDPRTRTLGRIGAIVAPLARVPRLALLGLALPAGALIYPLAVRELPPRPRDQENVPTTWLKSYADVIDHLKSLDRERYLVIATMDENLYPVWCGLWGRHSYFSDALTTALPDTITERRYMELCKFLGLSGEQFITHVVGPEKAAVAHTIFYRFGQGKYAATRAYSLDPIDTYTPADQEKIRKAPLSHAWNMVISLPERARLLKIYDTLGTTAADLSGRLDVIVLRRPDIEFGMRVTDPAFIRTLETPDFEVWQRHGEP